jgi:hypothetical protein
LKSKTKSSPITNCSRGLFFEPPIQSNPNPNPHFQFQSNPTFHTPIPSHPIPFSSIFSSTKSNLIKTPSAINSRLLGRRGGRRNTHTYLQREIEEAKRNGHAQGKPGGLLNRLTAHDNRKTEEQLAREAQRKDDDGVIR